jgi:hypothetical protein
MMVSNCFIKKLSACQKPASLARDFTSRQGKGYIPINPLRGIVSKSLVFNT